MLRKIIPVIVFFLSLALFSHFTFAASSVWKVQKEGYTLYLAGTLHLLTNDDYPLPQEFDTAFNASDTIFFETDLTSVQSPQFQQAMLAAMHNNGKKLNSLLTPNTWSLLKKQLASRGIPMEQFNDFKVSMVLLTLTIAEYQIMGFTAPGVDATFHAKSSSKNKSIKYLETPEQQLKFLADMGADDPEKIVKYTLQDLANMPKNVAKLKNAWRQGDLLALEDSGLKEMQADYPKIFESLITSRNENWLKQINKLINTPETEALYVGALHLAGDSGLVARLKEMGYRVEQL